MRGMTLTFYPVTSTNTTQFVLGKARVNEVVSGQKKGTGTHADQLTFTVSVGTQS